MDAICASSRRTSASEGAPGAGRNAAGTGWAGGTGRGGCRPAGVSAAEEAAAGEAPNPGEDLGAAAGRALCGGGALAAGVEAPQPALNVAARISAAAVSLSAPFGRRDP